MNNLLPYVYLYYSVTTEKGFLDEHVIELNYPQELTQPMEIVDWALSCVVNRRSEWRLEKVEVRSKNTRYVYM